MDEATSALDPESQAMLMTKLPRSCPNRIISVGHRPELEEFHDRKVSWCARRRAKLVPGEIAGPPISLVATG